MTAESEILPTYIPGTDTEEIPSFLLDETTGNLKYMSPPRTTSVFLVSYFEFRLFPSLW